MDKNGIIELVLKHKNYILKKTVMLILRALYLIMLFFIITFSLAIEYLSLAAFYGAAIGNADIGAASILFLLNLLCVFGNIVVAVIALFIDRFTFVTHIVFAFIHVFFCLLMFVSVALGIYM